MRRAVFLDRDGVLNVYLPGDYAKHPDDLTLLPGVDAAVARLREAGFVTVLISNQQGVGKGLMTNDDLAVVTAKLTATVALDAVYYCPHLKADECTCRKPKPGMLLRAAAEHDIDLAASYFVGDTPGDSGAARAAGIGAFVLVLTGQTDAATAATFAPPPDQIVPDLSAAVDWILGHTTR